MINIWVILLGFVALLLVVILAMECYTWKKNVRKYRKSYGPKY
jgi:uncharacterized membrane protein